MLILLSGCKREETTTTLTTEDSLRLREDSLSRSQPIGDTFAYSTDTSGRTETFRYPKLRPLDEGVRDTSFSRFRQQLLASLLAKDSSKLFAVMDKNIRWSFGATNGVQSLKKRWTDPKVGPKLWQTLYDVLTMGGAWQKGDTTTFWAPYTFAAWPEKSTIDGKPLDGFEFVAITKPRAFAYATPDSSLPAIDTLSYDILQLIQPGTPTGAKPLSEDWAEVVLSSARTGYVRRADLRSPLDYRAAFKRVNGEWKMIAFVAGD